MIAVASLTELARHTPGHRVAVACGVFDGVHRGHQKIFQGLLQLAAREKALPVVMTFDPHPRAVLSPDDAPSLLTTNEQRLGLFEQQGVKAAVVLPFTRHLAEQTPGEFVDEQLLKPDVHLVGICVGEQWRFGARGTGGLAFLRTAGRQHGFTVAGIPEFLWYGKPVSSTRIRQAVLSRRLHTAAAMLGRPHTVHGEIVRGKGIGHSRLGCPTANVRIAGQLLPPDGVYAVHATLRACGAAERESAAQVAIAYVGRAPTFGDCQPSCPTVEVHLLNPQPDLYGRQLDVAFIRFLRNDRKFSSVEALAAQIRCDIDAVHRMMASSPK